MTLSARLAVPLIAAATLALAACHKQADTGTATPTGTTAAASGPVGPAPAGGWTEQVVQTPEGGFRMGSPAAPVTLVEWGSRTCPHCGAFAKEAMPDLKKMVDTGKLSYEFRDFPIHAPDLAAILLGQCNGAASFFPLLESMFADQVNVLPKFETLPPSFQQSLTGKTPNQQAQMWAEQLGYTQFVGQRGVPAAKAQACLADPKAVEAISARLQKDSGRIEGTPSFTINNGDVVTNLEWPQLKAQLTAAGA
ncbi:thioredoxin domain-containing protein [uncultured Sphingomonas sp.]|uniref:thioredoxin domain-containing protein n=1 Tax=uncultured Sphingomonas sp. TaxID=158754 RepID=UPI002639CBCA|nr:thioredoxin domain-containing protein [uncultured Sphingomonas sp.]